MFLGEVLKHRVHVHTNADDDDMMMMVMMMMTLMKLVNSATKFRHGIDKFYQPNSGLRGSKTWDEAIYTYVHIYIYTYTYIHIHVQYMYIIYTYVLCTFHIVAGWYRCSFGHFGGFNITLFFMDPTRPGSRSTCVTCVFFGLRSRRFCRASHVMSWRPWGRGNSLGWSK